jgi:hypothetical protein
MAEVAVEITRFVEAYQPGIVECILIDATGTSHTFIEKVPVVSHDDLWSTSTYPQAGSIACEILEEWKDENGISLAKINTMNPWSVESVSGLSEFVVRSTQLIRT